MIYSIITSTAPFYSACIKIDYRSYEISISCDSSCKIDERMLIRSDLRVYKGDQDVTKDICGSSDSIYRPSLDDLCKIKSIIDGLEDK